MIKAWGLKNEEMASCTEGGNTIRIPIGSSQPTINGQATTIQDHRYEEKRPM